jgi:hypothetical protein
MNNPTWLAILKDGTQINQFNKDNIENRFKLILDKMPEVKYFILDFKEKNIQFIVDLEHGIIANHFKQLINFSQEKKDNLRLIHFRRHQVQISERDLKEQSHTIEYHLGIQWQDSEKRNHKIILIIDEEGNFIIN